MMRVRLQTQSQLIIARCWFKYLERKHAKEEEEIKARNESRVGIDEEIKKIR